MNEGNGIKAQLERMIALLSERLDDAEKVDGNLRGAGTSAKRVRAALLQVKTGAHELRAAVTASRKAAKGEA